MIVLINVRIPIWNNIIMDFLFCLSRKMDGFVQKNCSSISIGQFVKISAIK